MKFMKILACVLAITLFVAQGAFAELKLSADAEFDTDFSSTSAEKATADSKDVDKTIFSQGGRVKLTFESKTAAESGFYWAAKGNALVKDDASVGVDDSWIEIGAAKWFMRIGRPEAESLFAKGQDTYVVGAPELPGTYNANWSRGRTNIGAQLNMKATDQLMVESAVMYGANGTNNVMGARPLVKFTAGGLMAKAGLDYYMESPQNGDEKVEVNKMGFGGVVEYKLSSVTVGASAAMGTAGGKDSAGKDLDEETTTSFWGYATASLAGGSLGAGAGMTMVEYDKATTEKSHMQGFIGFNKPLSVKGATFKICGSYATGSIEKEAGKLDRDNSAFGVRIRLNYSL